jgi:hypothetical protein
MDVEVLSSREIEIEVRFRRVQTGTLETVQKNRQLLEARPNIPQRKNLLTIVETSCSERSVDDKRFNNDGAREKSCTSEKRKYSTGWTNGTIATHEPAFRSTRVSCK